MAEKTVTIPEKDYKTLVDDNTQNKATIEELIAKVNDLTSAQLAGVGVDPQAAARSGLKSELVQFTRNYNRAAIPSELQKGTNTHEAYSAECGDIHYLKVDEIARLEKDQPGLLITKETAFRKKMRYKPVIGTDEAGKRVVKMVEDPLMVDKLQEKAEHFG